MGAHYIPAMSDESQWPYRRLAVVGAWARWRDEAAYANAANRLGLQSRVFDVLHWRQRIKQLAAPMLAAAIERFEPDIILCTREAQLLGFERLRRLFRNRTAVMWHVDPVAQDGVLELARACGTLYLTYAGQRQWYRDQGVPVVRFLPQAMAPERDVPSPDTRPEYRCDVSFVGSGPYPYRWPVLQAVAAACRLQVRGPGWDNVSPPFPVVGPAVHGRRLAQVIAGAAVSLGASALPAQHDDYASASDRMWRIMAGGGAYVGEHVAGIEQFATPGEHCLWYRSPDECVEQVRALLADPERRRAMADRGRAHALAHHTYDHRLRLLLRGEEYPLR